MLYSIDKMDEEMAVLVGDDASVQFVALSALPAKSHEGDLLQTAKEGEYTFDKAATDDRRKKVGELLEDVLTKNPKPEE